MSDVPLKLYGVPFSAHTRKVLVGAKEKGLELALSPLVPMAPDVGPLLAMSGHSDACQIASALPPKADIGEAAAKRPLLTHSGHLRKQTHTADCPLASWP